MKSQRIFANEGIVKYLAVHKMPGTTNIPELFEIHEGYACFRPVGSCTAASHAGVIVSEGIVYAHEHEVPLLLIDVRRLTGFPPPTIAERYFMIRDWSTHAKGIVAVAVLAIPEMLDPHGFGVLVAYNAGLRGDIFTSETEAVQWLLSKP